MVVDICMDDMEIHKKFSSVAALFGRGFSGNSSMGKRFASILDCHGGDCHPLAQIT